MLLRKLKTWKLGYGVDRKIAKNTLTWIRPCPTGTRSDRRTPVWRPNKWRSVARTSCLARSPFSPDSFSRRPHSDSPPVRRIDTSCEDRRRFSCRSDRGRCRENWHRRTRIRSCPRPPLSDSRALRRTATCPGTTQFGVPKLDKVLSSAPKKFQSLNVCQKYCSKFWIADNVAKRSYCPKMSLDRVVCHRSSSDNRHKCPRKFQSCVILLLCPEISQKRAFPRKVI